MSETPKVYAAISAVQKQLSIEGISKDRKNQQQGFSFRGIDDIFNSLSGLLAANGLCILPRVLTRSCTERETAKGGVLFYVVIEVEFDFVCAEDGSKHVVRTIGEAMDSADKATNKAMSAAYKYAALQAFCIPTEGDNDADATTHEVAPRPQQTQRPPDDRPLSMTAKRDASEAFADRMIARLPQASPSDLNTAEAYVGDQFKAGKLHEHDRGRVLFAIHERRIALCEAFADLETRQDEVDDLKRQGFIHAQGHETLLIEILERRVQLAETPDEIGIAESQVASFKEKRRIDSTQAEVWGGNLANKRGKAYAE